MRRHRPVVQHSSSIGRLAVALAAALCLAAPAIAGPAGDPSSAKSSGNVTPSLVPGGVTAQVHTGVPVGDRVHAGQTLAFGRSVNVASADNAVSEPSVVATPCTGSIGDFVWNDADRDGIQDANELDMGINGVRVILTYLGQSTAVTTSTGGPNNRPGYYQFEGLCAGAYTVSVDTASAPLVGLVPPINRSANGNDGVYWDSNEPAGTQVYLPTNSTSNQTVDFGYFTPCTGSIGDYVWNDANRDGLQDSTEMGIDGVTLILTSPSGSTATTTFTGGPNNKPGYYQFAGLCTGGDYSVAVDPTSAPLAGLVPTINRSVRGFDLVPNDSNEPTGTWVILPADNASNQTVDFGYYAPCSGAIGDYVWNDANRDGRQDPTEMGIDGVIVILTKPDGTAATATTFTGGANDQPGYYQFGALCTGDYSVAVDPNSAPLAGLVATINRSTNGDDGIFWDSNEPNGTQVHLPTNSTSNQNVDFGYYTACSGAIGDYVWLDANGDGVQDSGELGINGVTVVLTKPGGLTVPATTFTGGPLSAAGYYQFEGLCAGTYTVEVNSSSAPLTGLVPTHPLSANGGDGVPTDSNQPAGTLVTLPSDASSNQTVDFGYVPARPAIDIEKYVNGDDADLPTGPVVPVGSPLTFTFVTTNTGNVPLAPVQVTDDVYGALCTIPSLAPGASQTCTVTVAAAAGQHTNIGTATGTPPPGVTPSPVMDTDPAHYFAYIPAFCSVELTKQCAIVPPPPSTSWVCSDAKPIDSMTVIWNGTVQPIYVRAWNGAIGTGTPALFGPINIGDPVTFTRTGTYPNDIYFELFSNAAMTAAVGTGKSTFHLSCSDADMTDPGDCGNAAGDGKARTGYENTWIFDGMGGNGLSFSCSPPNSTLEWKDSCSIDPQPNPSCTTEGKPTSLTFKYVPAGCSVNNNPQGGKYTCVGGVPGSPALITSTTSGLIFSPNPVAAGQEFSVSGSFGADTKFTIGGTQTINIHTSCSQVLEVGNIFASLQLVAFNGDRGGTQVRYRYVVKNDSNGALAYDLVDKVGDTIVNQYLGQTLASGATATFDDFVAMLNASTTNTATVNGSVGLPPNQAFCSPSDSVTVTVPPVPPCVTGTVPISADFNGTAIAGGNHIWLHSNFKPKAGAGRDGGSEYSFSGVSVTLAGTAINLPAAVILYSAAVDTATTMWDTQGDADPSNDRWVTYVPAGFDKEVFLTGVPYLVPAGGLPGGIKGVTMTGSMVAESGSDVDWKWSAAVYTSFSSDPAAIGVKPIEGSALNPYPNSDHVGTPENFKAFVVGGARGGGGSNYTGSWSGTKTLTPCAGDIPGVPLPPQPPACGLVTAGPSPTFADKKLLWTITNNGASTATLEQVVVIWPATNGALSKVKLDGDNSWDSTINCVGGTCFANITSDMFVADLNKKSIKAGDSRLFALEFQNTASTDLTKYSVVIDFGGACTISYNAQPPTCGAGLTIGDYVWYDANNNGIQDGTEQPAAGVTVVLKGIDGATLYSQTTDADGAYSFIGTNVCAGGTYLVEMVPPSGYGSAVANASGSTTSNDSNANPTVVRLVNASDPTIDFGLTDAISYCPTSPVNGVTGPVGSLFVKPYTAGAAIDPGAGLPWSGPNPWGTDVVIVRYDQSFAVNDNTYGTGSSWGHKVGDLVGSDMGQFAIFSDSGVKVLEFKVDYVSALASAPSGYASLGILGGEGGLLSGNGAWVLDATTSLDMNLNEYGYCTGGATGNCRTGTAPLLVNSGPTADTTYTGTPQFSLINSYYAVIDAAAFGGLANLTDTANQVRLVAQHNSPQKVGSFVPTVCR